MTTATINDPRFDADEPEDTRLVRVYGSVGAALIERPALTPEQVAALEAAHENFRRLCEEED